MSHSLVAVADAVCSPSHQCVDKGAVIVVLGQRQCLLQHLHCLPHLLGPLDQLTAI